jgi:hypothetical protein
MRNIGLQESLTLTAVAVAREVAAYSLQREKANEIWAAAVDQIYQNADNRPGF